jgi:hypothetical protein
MRRPALDPEVVKMLKVDGHTGKLYLPWSFNQELPQDFFVVLKMRANRRCESCGKWCIQSWSRELEVHHIDRDPLNNEIENLIVVCKKCHRDRTFRRGWTNEC